MLHAKAFNKMCAIYYMASHTKWYPAAEDVIVPWNARYSYPGQANKSIKTTPRISPKNGASFSSGSVVRLEFPAQGYVNPRNTTLSFDVYLNAGTCTTQLVRFQNNIQTIFSRARLMYGSTPLEDIINYNVMVRSMTEWTTQTEADHKLISDGIGGATSGFDGTNVTTLNARQSTHGISTSGATHTYTPAQANNSVGSPCAVKRYQVQLAFGLFTQDKLIPVKFMASQLAIELTIANAASALFQYNYTAGATPVPPSFEISNVILVPEILEFDAAYDAMFIKGLKEGGVPIKFSSWHTYSFSIGNQSSANVQIQERSRSVKSIFTVQRISPDSLTTDSHATIFHSATSGTLQQYQYRIGGRYYPAAPVQTAIATGGSVSNGGTEALVELQKALKTLGDFRLQTGLTSYRWGYPHTSNFFAYDGTSNCTGITNGIADDVAQVSSAKSATVFSQAYCSAINLETTDGTEISGLNAEEQSDIIFQAQWSTAQASGYVLEAYVYYDAMLVIRENNVVELIQ